MKFIDDIFGDLVGTCHPYQQEKVPNATYERNPLSTACIPYDAHPNHYFAGGFQGGRSKDYLELCVKISYNINTDMNNGIIAKWHDESHLNKYFYEDTPDKVLTSDYCTPEGKQKHTTKIIALNKDHDKLRS